MSLSPAPSRGDRRYRGWTMTSRLGGYEYREFVASTTTLPTTVVTRRTFSSLSTIHVAHTADLELGCGTGRVLIPTAVGGCDITGLDLSPDMSSVCQEKLGREPQDVRKRVRLIRGNMTAFETGEVYSLVTIPFRPFQHLIDCRPPESLPEVRQPTSHSGRAADHRCLPPIPAEAGVQPGLRGRKERTFRKPECPTAELSGGPAEWPVFTAICSTTILN